MKSIRQKWTEERILSIINNIYNDRKVIRFVDKTPQTKNKRKSGFTYNFIVECLKCKKQIKTSFHKLLTFGCRSCNLQHEHKDAQEKWKTEYNSVYSSYRIRSQQNLLEFSLTKEEFYSIITKSCAYCGIKSSNVSRGISYNGIDRIDSNLGYIFSNCAPCCKICNFAKSNLTIEEFKSWINRLIKFNERK